MGKCNPLSSLNPFLSYASQLSGANLVSLLTFILAFPQLLSSHHGGGSIHWIAVLETLTHIWRPEIIDSYDISYFYFTHHRLSCFVSHSYRLQIIELLAPITMWTNSYNKYSHILSWRRKQTEQAPSWKQDSILGWSVDFELYAQYLWKWHTNWKIRPPHGRALGLIPRLSHT